MQRRPRELPFNTTDFAISGLSALLASVIAAQSFLAYRRTGRDYLLNYFAGFLLLAVSFAVLLPADFGVRILACCGHRQFSIESFPPRYILQTFAYILIALAYSRNRWEKQLLAALGGLLVLLIALVLLLPQVAVPRSLDTVVHVADLAVVGYTLYHLLRFSLRSQRSRRTGLVFVGFLLILFSQYTFVIHGLDVLRLTNLLAKTLQLLGLGTLVLAFVVVIRRTTSGSGGKNKKTKDANVKKAGSDDGSADTGADEQRGGPET